MERRVRSQDGDIDLPINGTAFYLDDMGNNKGYLMARRDGEKYAIGDFEYCDGFDWYQLAREALDDIMKTADGETRWCIECEEAADILAEEAKSMYREEEDDA